VNRPGSGRPVSFVVAKCNTPAYHPGMDETRKAATYRLSGTARALLARRAAALAISRTALLELLIRQEAERKVPSLGEASDAGRGLVQEPPAERKS
jgi:hypothetical protein